MSLSTPPKPENYTLTMYLPNDTIEEYSTGHNNVKAVGISQQTGASIVEFNDGGTIMFHPGIPHKLERRPAALFTQ